MREAIHVAGTGSDEATAPVDESADALMNAAVDEEKDGDGLGALVFGFLASPAGQALNARLADWVGSHNDGNRERQKRETTELHWRYVLMALVIATASGLKIADKLDSTLVGFLGLALGYLFGRTSKPSD